MREREEPTELERELEREGTYELRPDERDVEGRAEEREERDGALRTEREELRWGETLRDEREGAERPTLRPEERDPP